MPRKSQSARATSSASSPLSRLHPPPTLSEPERRIFLDLISACAADHFRQSDLPLLCRYCEAIDLAERAAKELRSSPVFAGKISPWVIVQEKAGRTIIALSMRLRLSPQARQVRQPSSPQQPISYYQRMGSNGNDGLHED
jgi:hypothetical protein